MLEVKESVLTAKQRLFRRAVFLFVVVTTSVFEVVLVERKLGVFRGGFGVGRAIASSQEICAFFVVYLLCQISTLGLIYILLAKLHGRHWNGRVFPIVVLLVPSSSMIGMLLLKFEVASYFGDAMSFSLIKALAGGSFFDAVLFVFRDVFPWVCLFVSVVVLVFYIFRLLINISPAPVINEKYCFGKRDAVFAGIFSVSIALSMFVADEVGNTKFVLNSFVTPSLARSLLSKLTDFDGDGFSYYSLWRDPAPFNPSVYPMALDVPNDGIDEDGFCGDYISASLPAVIGTAATKDDAAVFRPAKHLVLVVLESTRGEVLGKKIDGRLVAPNINEIAHSGTAAFAYSHVGYTVPSLKNIFTGQLEPVAGSASLFKDLKARGFRIGVISGQPESFGDVSTTTGMKDSTDVFIDAETLKDERAFSYAAKGSLLVDESKLIREFNAHYGSKSQWGGANFIYMNFQSAHFPYHHDGMKDLIQSDFLPRSEISPANRDRLVRTYWNAVAWSDYWVGELVKRLKELGVYDDTLLVVTADHGESLFDDGLLGHGLSLNDIQTKIPFVMNRKGVVLPDYFGLVNYREIILDVLRGVQPKVIVSPVFQLVGPLDAPRYIGVTGGSRMVLDLESRMLRFADGRGADFDKLDVQDKAVGCRLISEWEKYRWEKYRLSSHGDSALRGSLSHYH